MLIPFKGLMQEKIMPAMAVQSSTIPVLVGKKDCWGLFPTQPIKKGTIVAVYCGKLMELMYAETLFWAKMGSHLKSICGKWNGHTLCGRVCKETPMQYYVDCGMMGSMRYINFTCPIIFSQRPVLK